MSFSALFVLFGLTCYGLDQLIQSGCNSEISEVVTSPDGSREAVAYQIGCGVLGDFNTQLTIRRAGESTLPERSDSLFAIGDDGVLPAEKYQNDSPKLTMQWLANRKLRVGYPKGPYVSKAEPSKDGVSIEYVRATD